MVSAAPLNALSPGSVVGPYRIEHVLGAGGFGITYKATNTATGAVVAIKEYLPATVASREPGDVTVRPHSSAAKADFDWGLERFRRESALILRLQHPNIVAATDYFGANGTAYLVMGYEEGKSLGQVLQTTPRLEESEVLEFLWPLLDGVAAVHAAGFLHRDIKPDNIFLRRDGTPVLLDFGAARQSLGTRTLTAVVTDGFAPYEQYHGDGNQGPWTDIYALGAVLFRCLAGLRAPEAPRRIMARMKGQKDPLADGLAQLEKRCSPAVARAIGAALALDEADRPQTVAAFAALLRGWSQPAPARQAPAKPEEASVAHAATLVAPVPARIAPARAGGARTALLAGLATVLLAGGAAVAYFAARGDAERRDVAEAPRPPDKADPPQADPPKADPPKADPPKADFPKIDPSKIEPPKGDPPAGDASKNDPAAQAEQLILRGDCAGAAARLAAAGDSPSVREARAKLKEAVEGSGPLAGQWAKVKSRDGSFEIEYPRWLFEREQEVSNGGMVMVVSPALARTVSVLRSDLGVDEPSAIASGLQQALLNQSRGNQIVQLSLSGNTRTYSITYRGAGGAITHQTYRILGTAKPFHLVTLAGQWRGEDHAKIMCAFMRLRASAIR